MTELSLVLITLIGSLLLGLSLFIYSQKKISYLNEEKTLYQERANRLPSLEELLIRKDDS